MPPQNPIPPTTKFRADGQMVTYQSGASANMQAAMHKVNKNQTVQAKAQTKLINAHKGGSGSRAGGTFNPPTNTKGHQMNALNAKKQLAGWKSSPSQLRSNPTAFGKTKVMMAPPPQKGGKRFRRGGTKTKPWGCYSGGKHTRKNSRRKSRMREKRTRRHRTKKYR